jgi:hypothetical protein
MHVCPEYFEFKNDYFMFGNKYARRVFFSKIPATDMPDCVLREIIETNHSLIVTKNIEFVDTAKAVEDVKRQISGMKREEASNRSYARKYY